LVVWGIADGHCKLSQIGTASNEKGGVGRPEWPVLTFHSIIVRLKLTAIIQKTIRIACIVHLYRYNSTKSAKGIKTYTPKGDGFCVSICATDSDGCLSPYQPTKQTPMPGISNWSNTSCNSRKSSVNGFRFSGLRVVDVFLVDEPTRILGGGK
jgi:hypothetical protein